MICDHNEKLASRGKKKNEKIVTLIFYYFSRIYLGVFLLSYIR